MALKNISRLSPRNKSSLISQISQLIDYYGNIIITRSRSYIKKLSEDDKNIYWVEDTSKKLLAFGIIDTQCPFVIDNKDFYVISHLVSTRPGQIESVIKHILTDYEHVNLILICKNFIAESINYQNYGFKHQTLKDIQTKTPDLANLKTDFFNIKNEFFADALSRKNYCLYYKFTNQSDLETIATNM